MGPHGCHRRRPSAIVDLGAGTGTGTLALAQLFPDAEVIAVDQSAEMLGTASASRPRALGLADRVRTVDAPTWTKAWPDVGPVDLVWASMSLHHLADPDRALADVVAALRPGGLLAVVEIDGQPRFLPDDLGIGRPGLEVRWHTAIEPEHAARVPHLGSDWDARFAAAGLPLVGRREFVIDLRPPLPAATGRYARAYLARIRSALEGRLDADDLATIDLLLDEHGTNSVLHRTDLRVSTVRTGWAVRRPS